MDPLWEQKLGLDYQLKDSRYMSTVLVHAMLRIIIPSLVMSLHTQG